MPRECEKWYNYRNILTSPCTEPVLSPLLPVVSHFSFVSTWKRSHFSLWFQSSGSPDTVFVLLAVYFHWHFFHFRKFFPALWIYWKECRCPYKECQSLRQCFSNIRYPATFFRNSWNIVRYIAKKCSISNNIL